ncbi:MAG: hypothetical protein JO328_12525 [Hyphomicrobiales bacterium]|nr:hypothetical protein [Hyphomicrobiales bacterium]MBV8823801.1 hypothetical protein [Hyphomicrobiales bacterium]MBV9428477.1 hypothetical protein [Bradyrhizobiaceae bacterium]
MRAANLITRSAAVLMTGFVVLTAVHAASAAPLPSSTAFVKAAAPAETTTVGYIYRDGDGALINSPLAVGILAASAVSPFYTPSYYPAYIYPGPPVAYAPAPYYGPAIVYGRPLLAADPYYPAFYPYIRGTGWRYRY